MARKYYFDCPYCDKRYFTRNKDNKRDAKESLYSHIEEEHSHLLGDMSPAQAYFNSKYNKNHGKCIVCRKPTDWNEDTEKYERLCSEKCKQEYREQFKKRMKKKYGKTHLLNDPEQQKKMLANRKISGEYKWSNGHKTKYTGSYEREFLEFLDHFMNMRNPKDVMMPAPQVFDYKYDRETKFYIPDVYIQSLNLIIEIKGSAKDNTHSWRKEELKKEKIKDRILKKSKFNYIKIVDKNYKVFLDYLTDSKI